MNSGVQMAGYFGGALLARVMAQGAVPVPDSIAAVFKLAMEAGAVGVITYLLYWQIRVNGPRQEEKRDAREKELVAQYTTMVVANGERFERIMLAHQTAMSAVREEDARRRQELHNALQLMLAAQHETLTRVEKSLDAVDKAVKACVVDKQES